MHNNDIVIIKKGKGYLCFKLKYLLKKKNISINKLMRDTKTDFKVIKRLMTGNIKHVDVHVLARLCDYLKCNSNDIIDYKKRLPKW